MFANFMLGELTVTEAAKDALHRIPLDLVARHAIGDHGLASARELKQNQVAMTTAGPIVSRYLIDPTQPARGRVMVVTRESWDRTTVQLESEHSPAFPRK